MSFDSPYSAGPVNPSVDAPAPNYAPPRRTGQPAAGSSIRGFAITAQLGLAVVAVASGYLLIAQQRQRHLVDRAIADLSSVSAADVQAADNAAHAASQIVLVAFCITAVLYVVWFWHARVRAEGFDASVHRRRRGWAIGGWICPIVNFWFPLQITRDILRASDVPAYDPASSRERLRPVVPIWWACLLLTGLLNRATAAHRADTLTALRDGLQLEVATDVVQILAALLALSVVRSVTAAVERRRALILADPAVR
jgi:hypothetical protein